MSFDIEMNTLSIFTSDRGRFRSHVFAESNRSAFVPSTAFALDLEV